MSTLTRQRIVDLLAIGRVANLPTVWSNVTLGFFLAWALLQPAPHGIPAGSPESSLPAGLADLALLLAACTGAYLFGTFLNDWKDVSFDREHRPERAIPSGRWSQRAIGGIALGFALAALIGFIQLGREHSAVPWAGAGLLACIVIYTVTHKKSPLAIVPMGLCRSLLYLLGFLLVFPAEGRPAMMAGGPAPSLEFIRSNALLVLALMALGILSYVAGLTLAARYESRPEQLPFPRALLWLLIFLPFLTHSWWWIWTRPPFLEGWHLAIPALSCLLPFLLWTLRTLVVLKRSIPDFVSRALAGLCLVDLLAYAGIAASIHTGWVPLDRLALLLAIAPLTLFVLALLLQRIAPAT